ncbi:MAG: DUF1015 domain-containing protein [Phycisphaeraceae bacterium]
MPEIHPIQAILYAGLPGEDVSDRIAPPYDVLDETSKAALLTASGHNVVAIDLPHLPPKTVGPDSAYAQAGETYRRWLDDGVLARLDSPALFVYRQTYRAGEQQFARKGLIANLPVQPFGKAPTGHGGIHAHEETFSAPKEDRLKLMRATQAQLSPIFGLYSDEADDAGQLLQQVIDAGPPTRRGITANDSVVHEMWTVDRPETVEALRATLRDRDVFIADGHHRYNTALNYKQELEAGDGDVGGAADCMFVLVAMQDPGMIVLPTHRVLGNMPGFDMKRLHALAAGLLSFEPVAGDDPTLLAEALDGVGSADATPHVIGLYDPAASAGSRLWLARAATPDPLVATHADRSTAWRALDVALVQHLLVERLCEPAFCDPGQQVTWKFPHELAQLRQSTEADGFQLGVVLRATPLEAVRQVSEAGELMPQKSTFFYPKLATGLTINPLA